MQVDETKPGLEKKEIKEKKDYAKPMVISKEVLEVVAATCDGYYAKANQFDCYYGPFSS